MGPLSTDMNALFAALDVQTTHRLRAEDKQWALKEQQSWEQAMAEDAAYERAENYHVWREEGGPLDDDYDMPDPDEPAEDLG